MIDTLSAQIEFCGVSHFQRGRTILDDLNFEVRRGELLVLLGESGCGKTTTLRAIARLFLPTAGEVRVEGKPTSAWHPIDLRRRIGYVIQEIGLFPHLTVAQNIGLVPSLLGWNRTRIRDRTHELLQLIGLNSEDFTQRFPAQLSGGQRQRVGVARALASHPPILLMDEPFAALDIRTRLEIQQEFRLIQQRLGMTVVFVTHDMQEAFCLADRIGLMHGGKIVEIGNKQEFLRSPVPQVRAIADSLQSLRSSLDF